MSLRLVLVLVVLLGLGACTSDEALQHKDPPGWPKRSKSSIVAADDQDGPPAPEDIPPGLSPANIPDAVPKLEPFSVSGNPDSYVVYGQRYRVLKTIEGYRERGLASWYGKKFQGKRTSTGEAYDMFLMTAAHKTLPIPCYVRITNLDNARSAIVRVNDRGPFHSERILDVSYAAALKLGMLGHGTTPVEVETIDPTSRWPDPLFANAPSILPQPITPSKPIPPAASSAPSITPSKAASRSARFLQAGAFADPIDAATMRDQLAGLGIQPVQLRSEAISGGYRYRVLIGPFADSDSLDATRSRLNGLRISSFPFVE